MPTSDLVRAKRLDGWKSIAGYFNRDRTTVMRWARERALPVRRLPGGKQGSVFAFEHELAAWATRQSDVEPAAIADDAPLPAGAEEGDVAEAADAPVPPPDADRPPVAEPPPSGGEVLTAPTAFRRSRLLATGLLATVVVALLALVLIRESFNERGGDALKLPRDPAVASTYVAARDAWARRTPRDLDKAIRLYRQVIARDPAFAPAHAGLSEAWLIQREYGGIDERTAYREARAAAEAALKLDPDLPAANRAMGFIDYWWSGDESQAFARFERAIDGDPKDWQTHFWLANVLAYEGRDAQAQREYEKARLLSPGSRVIDVEQACSHWLAGRDGLAIQQLTALARETPDDATIHTCLGWARISQGDIGGFAEAMHRRAVLRREPRAMAEAAALDAAVRRDPASAVRVLVEQGRQEIAAGSRRGRETPAFFASSMGDRASLIALLTEAADLGEHWSTPPLIRRIAARWRGDPEVEGLLKRVTIRAT